MKKYLLPAALFLLACAGAFAAKTVAAKVKAEQEPVVYFSKEISPAKIQALYDKLNFKPEGKLGIKIHFGEEGNKNFIPPALVKDLVLKLKGTFVDTNTLYGGSRGKTKAHLETARSHGWTYAPVDILDADGEITLPYKGKYFEKVYIGKHMADYGSFLVISHFKGHGTSGIGGAIKNLAMGFGSPTGKKAQHSGMIPEIDHERCQECGTCRKVCPVGAIDENYNIDRKKCIGCGKCKTYCPYNAIDSASGPTKGPAFQEKLAEYAKGVTSRGKFTYINLAMNISRSCDCSSNAPKPFMDDVGVLASNDPVALDQASYDLVNQKTGLPDTFQKHSGISGLHALEYAETIGLGRRKYKLVEIK